MRDTIFPQQRMEALERVRKYGPLDYFSYRKLEGEKVDRETVRSETAAIPDTVKVSGDLISLRMVPKARTIPLDISTGYGTAVLIRAGQDEGFGDAPSIDFDEGKVVGAERDRKYFEERGFSFTPATEGTQE